MSATVRPGANGFVVRSFKAVDYVELIEELLSVQGRLAEIAACNHAVAERNVWAEVAAAITARTLDGGGASG